MSIVKQKNPVLARLIWFLIVFIITVPAFSHLLNGQYFSMHDDQQVARLFLLDQGIRQGYLYPRWVDLLGFGYGYPLFNFYPPLVYYIGEVFHLLGLSLIWSIKLTFILGFVLSAWGAYLFSKNLFGKIIALVPTVLYTYFFYHAVNAYVRGALAEFFSMAILPFVFLSLKKLFDEPKLKHSLFFAITLALLVLNHPLIALPAVFFIVAFFVFYVYKSVKNRLAFTKFFIFGVVIGLCLSAFFWLPSLTEKKYTYVDKVLTHELADYTIHFIYPQQFWYSLWGYGGSVAGPEDGITFQLGKAQIGLFILAIILSGIYLYKKKKNTDMSQFYFLVFLAVFSLFMTIQASSFIWRSVSYLAYLQFPWRFLTFAGFFLSVVGGYSVFFLKQLYNDKKQAMKQLFIMIVIFCLLVIGVYSRYFKPQYLKDVTDQDLTSPKVITWDVSRTSFEFVPQGIRTTKTALGTTTLDIQQKDLPTSTFFMPETDGYANQQLNTFRKKTFFVHAFSQTDFILNTFFFPGWVATLTDIRSGWQSTIDIRSDNDLRLMTVPVPKGTYILSFEFKNTLVRTFGDTLSLIGLLVFISLVFYLIPEGTAFKKFLKRLRNL